SAGGPGACEGACWHTAAGGRVIEVQGWDVYESPAALPRVKAAYRKAPGDTTKPAPGRYRPPDTAKPRGHPWQHRPPVPATSPDCPPTWRSLTPSSTPWTCAPTGSTAGRCTAATPGTPRSHCPAGRPTTASSPPTPRSPPPAAARVPGAARGRPRRRRGVRPDPPRQPPPGDATGRAGGVTTTLTGFPLLASAGPGTGIRLTSPDRGADAALTRVLITAAELSARGLWARLEMWPATACPRIFLDRSRPRRGRWCSPPPFRHRLH